MFSVVTLRYLHSLVVWTTSDTVSVSLLLVCQQRSLALEYRVVKNVIIIHYTVHVSHMGKQLHDNMQCCDVASCVLGNSADGLGKKIEN